MPESLSVIITVYNGRLFLRSAVLSVLSQQVENLECVVIDDGSSDGSLDSIADLGVRCVALGKNRGFPGALNEGLRLATGDLVTFLDCDDLLAEGSLQWRLQWMRANPERDAVGGRPAGIIDDAGALLPEYRHVGHPDYRMPRELTLEYFASGEAYPVMVWNYLFRRSLIDTVGLFDESFKIACDFDYLLRVLRVSSIPIVDSPTVYRRLHANNLSLDARDGGYSLKEGTIEECRRILAPLGVEPSQWILWEKGYRE